MSILGDFSDSLAVYYRRQKERSAAVFAIVSSEPP
jgi:hypothetical protein